MRGLRRIALGALLFAGAAVHAEKGDWRVSAYFQESSLDLTLVTLSDYRDVWLWTNTGMRPGMEIRYRNYGVSLAPPLFGSIQDDPRQPATRYQDFKLFYYGDRWGGEGYYQYFRGLHSDPPTGAEQVLHEGMKVNAQLVNVYHAPLNPWFPESRVRNMRDGRPDAAEYYWSAHLTPLLFLSASRHSIDAGKPFLEGVPGAENSVFGTMRRARTQSLIAGGMVVFNLDAYGFYFDPNWGMGLGYQANQSDQEPDRTDVGTKYRWGARLGYYASWFDLGVLVQADQTEWRVNADESLGYESIYIRLYLEVFL